MRKLAILLIVFISYQVLAWGPTGHRSIGKIAESHLTKKAGKKVRELLGDQSLAMATTWMDDVRSDRSYDHMSSWHWVTVEDGEYYESTEKNPEGDIIETLERLITALKGRGLERHTEVEYLKVVVHLVGDIHQPLHVGNGNDQGGNEVKVKWFGSNSNLHRVWDSDMIESQMLSFSELALSINHPTKEEITVWQEATIREWAMESHQLRTRVYDIPENKSLGYEYRYKNWPIVERRLLQAGVRLAGILNNIYDP